jgi:hypothetical protein
MRRTTNALVIAAAAMLMSGAALAQQNQAAPPGQAKAADAAKKTDDKGKPTTQPGKDAKDAANKADAKSGKTDGTQGKTEQAPGQTDKQGAAPADQPTDEVKLKERATRQRAQRDAERAKVTAALKGQAMTDGMKQELRRHAQRIARLQRIKELAANDKDDATTGRVDKLVEKENARHDKWMTNFDAKADTKVGAK